MQLTKKRMASVDKKIKKDTNPPKKKVQVRRKRKAKRKSAKQNAPVVAKPKASSGFDFSKTKTRSMDIDGNPNPSGKASGNKSKSSLTPREKLEAKNNKLGAKLFKQKVEKERIKNALKMRRKIKKIK